MNSGFKPPIEGRTTLHEVNVRRGKYKTSDDC